MRILITLMDRLGGMLFNVFKDAGNIFLLGLSCIRWMLRLRIFMRQILQQSWFIGIESIPVVAATGAFAGMVLVYESYSQLNRLGMDTMVGPLAASSLVLQLGPVLVGIMLAGRVGGAMTAELGTMNVTEQIDALETMGTHHVPYLVLPRVIASTLLAPVLNGVAMVVGVLAAFALAIHGLGVQEHFVWEQTKAFIRPYNYFCSSLKAGTFGFVMALICCNKGITTTGGAAGVGESTTSANVSCCIAILLLNLFLTMLLFVLEPILNPPVEELWALITKLMEVIRNAAS